MKKKTDVGERTCMDCGKTFKPTFDENDKLFGCWFWGVLNPSMKYQYFLKMHPKGLLYDIQLEESGVWWRKLLKKYVPCYHFPHEQPTITPIIARWWLKIREQ